MYSDTQPTGVGLSVVCDGVEWPDDPEVRREMGQQVEAELCATLAALGIPATQTTVYNRYVYAQVDLSCPVCRAELTVGTVERPPGAFAYIPVDCRQCGWSSRAVYSLIDYHDEITWTELAGGASPEAVAKYDDLTPRYDPYPRLLDDSGQLR